MIYLLLWDGSQSVNQVRTQITFHCKNTLFQKRSLPEKKSAVHGTFGVRIFPHQQQKKKDDLVRAKPYIKGIENLSVKKHSFSISF